MIRLEMQDGGDDIQTGGCRARQADKYGWDMAKWVGYKCGAIMWTKSQLIREVI